MKTYRSLTPAVYRSQLNLRIVTAAATREDGATVADVAREHDCSVRHVHALHRRVLKAVTPGKPGPRRAVRAPTVPAKVTARADAEPRALTYVLTTERVSIRGIQTAFDALTLPIPARDTIVDWLRAAGRAARRLLARARGQVRATLRCLAGDDIFFHRTAVKVLMEPVSGAVLDVMRWPWRKGEEWALWLGEWPARHLLVSDLGVDLVWAAKDLTLAQQADLFHERKWWTKEVFKVLSQREKKLAKAVLKALARATRVEGPGRRLGVEHVEAAEAERVLVEAQFYAAVRAEEHLLTLFEPLDPRGRLWNDESVADVLDAVCVELVKASDDVGLRAWTHVHTYRANWCAHRVLWDVIEVQLAPGTSWDRARVVEAVVAMLVAEEEHTQASEWALSRASQERAVSLRAELARACTNLAEVEREARSLRATPRRSSSLVEAFNSVLRGLQMVHRNVSDDLLALCALRWNLRPRKEGRRRGASPFARLGIDFADDERPWYEVLIEEIERE